MPKRWLRVRLVVRKHRYKLRYLPVASGLEKAQTTVHCTYSIIVSLFISAHIYIYSRDYFNAANAYPPSLLEWACWYGPHTAQKSHGVT